MADLMWCCRDQQRACRMAKASVEKLEQTGPAEKERVASVPQRAVGKNAGAAFAKRKSCTNQKPSQRGSAIPDPVWVGSK